MNRRQGSRAAAMDRCVNVADFEAAARRRLRRADYDYYAGGAEDERSLVENCAAYGRIFLRPRVLVDVSRVDMATTVLGVPVSMPVLVAPTAYHRLAHPEGECATARGAGRASTLMAVSTLATRSLEEVAEAATGPLWFQLYVHRDRNLTLELVRRAAAAGYRALCLTVDVPRLGRRERDLRNRFVLPPRVSMANFEGAGSGGARWKSRAGMADFVLSQLDATLTWDSVARFVREGGLPVLVKGVIAPEDAVRAVEAGAVGVIVSNHGARQLDGAEATITALPGVVDAVAGRAEVYVDGGIRRGSDVLKALALGARAVLVGRPVLWGLAVGGEEGVAHVLDLLRAELELSMALCGCPTVSAITRDLVAPS